MRIGTSRNRNLHSGALPVFAIILVLCVLGLFNGCMNSSGVLIGRYGLLGPHYYGTIARKQGVVRLTVRGGPDRMLEMYQSDGTGFGGPAVQRPFSLPWELGGVTVYHWNGWFLLMD